MRHRPAGLRGEQLSLRAGYPQTDAGGGTQLSLLLPSRAGKPPPAVPFTAVSQQAVVAADGGGRACVWRNALIWPLRCPPAVTELRDYLVTRLSSAGSFFHAVSEVPLSQSASHLAVDAVGFGICFQRGF